MTVRDLGTAIIGGLTLALALHQRWMQADVHGQAVELAEAGAVVALSVSAIRELRRLGILVPITTASCGQTGLTYRDGRTGARIAAHPVHEGRAYQARSGVRRNGGIHSADMQRTFRAALVGEGLHLGHNVLVPG
jgi:salicylate hydroxylase